MKCLPFLISIMFLTTPSHAGEGARIKDLVNVKGVRSNTIIGYGLVVGLAGTGDSSSSLSTNRSIANMLTRMGIVTKENEIVAGNVAAVVATVDLHTFARSGDKLDVRISTIGDAKSLAGGTLITTPLKAGNGQIYAVAQGAVLVGQATGSGASVLTVANVSQGAIVEREFAPTLAKNGTLDLHLKKPDFTTNSRISEAINRKMRGFIAESLDPSTVRINVPEFERNNLVSFVSKIEAIKIVTDRKAMVVINERTGTVVMGTDIQVGNIAISHGDLTISIKDDKGSQDKSVVNLNKPTIGELIETLNTLGVRPKDLISIIHSIHAAGALQADIKLL